MFTLGFIIIGITVRYYVGFIILGITVTRENHRKKILAKSGDHTRIKLLC